MIPNIYMFHRIELEPKQFIAEIYYNRGMVHKIGELYKKLGLEQLGKNRINSAKRLLSKAIRYKPEIRNNLSQEILAKAKSQQDINLINGCLDICQHFGYNTDKQFAEIYFTASQNDNCKNPVNYLQKAVSLDSRESLPYSKALLEEFKKLKEQKSVKEMRALVKKYGQSLTKKDREFLAPPPVWTEVPGSRTEVIGEGFGPDDKGNLHLPIKNLKKGDKYVIISKHFQMKKFFGSVCKWVSYYGRKEQLCTVIPNGDPFAFKAEKGEKAVVFVLRLE